MFSSIVARDEGIREAFYNDPEHGEKRRLARDWAESASDTAKVLMCFQVDLGDLVQRDDVTQADIQALFRPLFDAGLDRWVGDNPLDVDKLAAILKGES